MEDQKFLPTNKNKSVNLNAQELLILKRLDEKGVKIKQVFLRGLKSLMLEHHIEN